MSESARTVLNSLIETCRDAERGLLHAATLVADPALQHLFDATARKRAEMAHDLLPHAQRLGGASTADGTVAASLHRKWMDVRDLFSGGDDQSILTEARRGDDSTALAFKRAVDGSLPATVRELVERGYAAVRASQVQFAELNRG
jgi:uncharacterized protein (TIGR02284 family)